MAAVRTTVIVFDGCDAMDVVGPYEVLLTASRLALREGAPAPFEVGVASPTGRAVSAYGGMGLTPTGPMPDPADVDLLVVPGLIDVDRGVAMADLVGAVAAHGSAEVGPVVASVCTGAFLLEAAGLLRDRPATTHHEDIDLLRDRRGAGAGPTVVGARWADAGRIVTGAGLSSGIAMALHLVDRFAGRDLAVRTAAQIEYPWDPAGRTDP